MKRDVDTARAVSIGGEAGKEQREHCPPPGPRSHPGGEDALAAAVRVVSGLTLVSRVAGLARDVLTARIFGDGLLGSAFRAAYAVPNLFRRLFGEGALSAAFLPEYALVRRDHPEAAGQLATVVVRLLTLVTGALTAVLMLALWGALALLPEDPDRTLSLRLMLLMLPMMPAVCLTAILGGMLQAHGRFGPPAAAPVLLNLFQIVAGMGFFLGWMTDRVMAAYVIGAAALLASGAQVAWSLWALRGRVAWSAAGGAGRKHARAVFSRFVPALVGLGTLQLNATMDMVIAMWPVWVGPTMFGRGVPLTEKSNAVLSYTQTIYQFPLGVFGIAVATAVFPLLSRSADRPGEFLEHLRRGLRLSFFIGLPATLGLILMRHELVEVFFGGSSSHAFSTDGLARSAAVLLGFAPGVWAYSLNHVLTRAFYARGDTRTPMRVSLAMVGLNLALNFSLIWWLREAGLAWATSIAAVAQCGVLMALARSRHGLRPWDSSTLGAFGRIAGASAIMGVAVWGLDHFLPEATTWPRHALKLGVCVGGGIGVYIFLARVMGLMELAWLLRRGPRDADAGPISME